MEWGTSGGDARGVVWVLCLVESENGVQEFCFHIVLVQALLQEFIVCKCHIICDVFGHRQIASKLPGHAFCDTFLSLTAVPDIGNFSSDSFVAFGFLVLFRYELFSLGLKLDGRGEDEEVEGGCEDSHLFILFE